MRKQPNSMVDYLAENLAETIQLPVKLVRVQRLKDAWDVASQKILRGQKHIVYTYVLIIGGEISRHRTTEMNVNEAKRLIAFLTDLYPLMKYQILGLLPTISETPKGGESDLAKDPLRETVKADLFTSEVFNAEPKNAVKNPQKT